jgi:hypothetical protein
VPGDVAVADADGVVTVVRWDRVLAEAAPLGFTPLAGSAPGVGVVGFLTGGGLGPLARTYGVSADRVSAFELVTGDGVLRRTTAEDLPELFWALKGGKGALGIVTAVEFDLVALPAFLGGALLFDGAVADRVLHTWALWCESLPLEATTSVAILRLPRMPGVPEPIAGRTTIAVRFAWTGDIGRGEEVIEPIRAAASVIFGAIGVLPPDAMGVIPADPVDPMPVSEHAVMLSELPSEAVDALLDVSGPVTACPHLIVGVRRLCGAIAEGSSEDGSFCGRDIAFTCLAIGIAAGPLAGASAASAAAIAAAMAPWDCGRRLPNFEPSTDPRHALKVYDPDTLRRLDAVVADLDPCAVISASRPIRGARALLDA